MADIIYKYIIDLAKHTVDFELQEPTDVQNKKETMRRYYRFGCKLIEILRRENRIKFYRAGKDS